MNTVGNVGFDGGPGGGGELLWGEFYWLLVVEEKYESGGVCRGFALPLEEHHLEICCHGYDFIHEVVGRRMDRGNLKQREQTIEVGVVAKT